MEIDKAVDNIERIQNVNSANFLQFLDCYRCLSPTRVRTLYKDPFDDRSSKSSSEQLQDLAVGDRELGLAIGMFSPGAPRSRRVRLISALDLLFMICMVIHEIPVEITRDTTMSFMRRS